ncbi:MAG: hypothetical protein QXR58_00475 [Candidatus Micrarchaeaceae archaeon]
MKKISAQSSMEFIMILVAVSAFSSAAVGIYLNASRIQSSSFEKLLGAGSNSSLSANAPAQAGNRGVYFSVYAPSIAYVNQSNSIMVVVYADNATLDYLSVSAPSVMHSPSAYSNATLSEAEVFPFSVVPERTGASNISISLAVTQHGSVLRYNKSVELYVEYAPFALAGSGQSSTAPALLSAALYPHSEFMLSSIDSGPALYNITEWSHCSYTGFFHQEESIQAECGNANWYFWIFSSSCYYNSGSSTVTYCIYENHKGASIDSIGAQDFYQYNITLSLYNTSKGIYLSSSLRNSSTALPLVSSVNGTRVGNVSISSSMSGYAPPQDYSYYLLNRSSSYEAVNSSSYSQYMQAYNNLNYVLNYYNDSGIGDSQLSTIQQMISSYNKESASIYNSAGAAAPCAIISSNGKVWYACKLISLEFDNITARFTFPPHQNSTSVVGGSNINIEQAAG